MVGFRIPEEIRTRNKYIFGGEEFLLVSLYRLHRPTALADACFGRLFGFSYSRVSECFNTFLEFMCQKWGYLLLDNMAFWQPYLAECAEAIRMKL